ncbi:MAG: dTDP-glucose 4,6-dehydratase [Candidatus Omnitrophica bacterium]|nr:dTDP-glucose 4,6-dehydratase [Candidatus Omnitrophota bacterium]MCM8770293.1 dTDP-glucose 4,6-dehydratase [Candidatus Omnitrophota bacterium]
MRQKLPKILVTGGAGFMGSAFVRRLCGEGSRPSHFSAYSRDLSPIVVDKLTYAGDLARLGEIKGKYKFYRADIADENRIESIFRKEKPQIIVNFAAESHVDRSIKDPVSFIKTNIIGTQVLLDISRKYGVSKFIHISTDEVYGDIRKGKFNEDSPLRPSSPYAASKAAADLLIKSYIRTFNFPAIIIRPCNNYGPWQYPEKLIPLSILKILRGEKVPVYARGKNIREWLYVEDCAQGILKIMEKGRIGEIYNLGSGQERENLEVIKSIFDVLHASKDAIRFMKDRPGHDIRYRLDSRKVFKEIDWKPEIKFEIGIRLTVEWCLQHKNWLLEKWKDIAPLYKNE